MVNYFLDYSETLSIVFMGLLGGIVGLIFDEEMITLKKIITHLFLGILAANYIGQQLCLWKHIEHCDFFTIISACVGNTIFLFITGGAKDVLLYRGKIIRRLLGKYLKNESNSTDE